MSKVLADEKGRTFTIEFLLIDPVNKYPSTYFTILSPMIKVNFLCSLCCLEVLDLELDVFSLT